MENFKKKYFIITYGCQMNLHESEKIAGILTSMGYENTHDQESADVIVFNTCCIRENAEDRAEGNIGALKSLKKKNKNLIIAVGGCMTQQDGYAKILHEKFPFVDIIFGTHNLENFKDLLTKKLSQKKSVIEVLKHETDVIEGTPKTRTSYPNAWVNIMYGCNNFCTYCIVPYVRGRERSRKMEDILCECKELISLGYKEITLLGQNVNSYGKDLGDTNFAMLLQEVCKIEGKFRVRFMTNHPKDFSEDLIKVISKNQKICRSIHLPIQAGSNNILKKMNRRYTRESYLEKVNLLRSYIPEISITTDIMVAFPAESEEDFEDTYSLMKNVEFAGAFTFIYSRRKGTPADVMDGQIPEEIGKQRIMKLIDLQNSINRDKSRLYVGQTVEILCEDFDEKKKMYLGRDTYGRMAYFPCEKDVVGEFVNVKITKAGGISLIGEIV